MTRKGKIARLPRDVRDELNQRLDNGEQGTHLVAWLNGLPEVKRVLAQCFNGREINDQNLSDWKAGGFLDWVAQEEEEERVRRLTEKMEDLASAGWTDDGLINHLATVLTIRYAEVLAEWNGQTAEELERKLTALRKARMDIVALRRSHIQAGRWDLEQAKYEDEIEAEIDKHERELRQPSYEAFMRDMKNKPTPEARMKDEGKRMKNGSVEPSKPEKEVNASAAAKAKGTTAVGGEGTKAAKDEQPYRTRRVLNPFLRTRRGVEAIKAIQGNSSQTGEEEKAESRMTEATSGDQTKSRTRRAGVEEVKS